MQFSTRFKHLFSLTNIVLGFVVSTVAVYLFITGDYENLTIRAEKESLLNMFVLGGLIYSFVFWFYDIFHHDPHNSFENAANKRTH